MASHFTAEYDALRSAAVVRDRSNRGRMRFAGDKARDVLAGLVSNDVGALRPGGGQYAAALTPKGRIVIDLRIFTGDGWFLTDGPERAWPAWQTLVKKYVNPRLSRYTDETASTFDVALFGPRASAAAAAITGATRASLDALAPYAHVAADSSLGPLLVARTPELGVAGFDVIGQLEHRDALLAAATDAGAATLGDDAYTTARIEAGRPEWGPDMDDETLPQEANFDELGAISYTKGCYTGQEVVARIHFRGHVNRHLRGLRIAGDAVPPHGAEIVDESQAVVGGTRSAALSPRWGAIALGMIRREVPIGATVQVRWDAGEHAAQVVALPFSD